MGTILSHIHYCESKHRPGTFLGKKKFNNKISVAPLVVLEETLLDQHQYDYNSDIINPIFSPLNSYNLVDN